MNLRERTFNATKWATLLNFSSYLGLFVLQLAIARILGPEIFGLAARVIAVGIILDQASEFGFTSAIIQRAKLERRHSNTAFSMNLMLAVVAASVGEIGVYTYAAVAEWTEFLKYLRFILPLPVVMALGNVHRALLARELDYRVQAWSRIAGVTTNIVVAVSMALSGFEIWSIIAGFYANHLTQASVLWVRVSWWPRLRIQLQALRELLSFGVYIGLARLLMEFTRNLEVLAIGMYLGDILAGLFSLGYRIGIAAVNQVGAVMSSVLFSSFSRLQEEPVRLVENYLKAVRYLAVASAVTTIVAYAVVPVFTAILGDSWARVTPVTRVLCVVALSSGLGGNLIHPVLAGVGRSDIRFALAVGVVICKTLFVFAAIQFGLIGVCVSVAIFHALKTVAEQWIVGQIVGFDIQRYLNCVWDVILAFCIAAISVHAVEILLPLEGLTQFVISTIAAIVSLGVYLLVLHLCDNAIIKQIYSTGIEVSRSRF